MDAREKRRARTLAKKNRYLMEGLESRLMLWVPPGTDEGFVLSGELRTGTITTSTQSDVYSIAGKAGGTIVASAGTPYTGNSDTMQTRVQLFGPSGQVLSGGDAHAPSIAGGVAVVTASDLPADGTYYAVVSSYDGNTGTYSFTSLTFPGSTDHGGDGGQIASGQTVIANIDLVDLDPFSFYASAGGSIYAVMAETASNGGFNPQITLFGPNNIPITTVWNSSRASLLATNLTQSGTYYLVASDHDHTGIGEYALSLSTSTTGSPAPILTSPGGYSAPGSILSTITPTFSWPSVPGADRYGLYVSKLQPDGSYLLQFDSEPITTLPQGTTSYKIPSTYALEDGGFYRWNMRSHTVAGGWKSEYSPRLYFSVGTQPIPATPTGLTVTLAATTTFNLDWNDAPGVVAYKVYRTGPSSPRQQIYYGIASQYTDGPTTLDLNKTYTYEVYATNYSGTSTSAATASRTTGTVVKPPTPTSASATPSGATTVNLSWADVISTGMYVVERSTSASGVFQTIARLAENVTTFVDRTTNGSTPQATFFYRVRSLVNGVLSDPVAVVAATIGYAVQQSPSNAATVPVISVPSTDVAQLYRWDYDNGMTLGASAAAGRPVLWDHVDDFTTIDWSKPTVILTHGWDDRLDYQVFNPAKPGDYDQDFMNIIGREFFANDVRSRSQYNLLAVDWYGTDPSTRARGSDPNDNRNFISDIVKTFRGDAVQSETNGVAAAEVLAQHLSAPQLHLQPNKLILVGHSNGAGFMARLARVLFGQTKVPVAELDALDAPYLTAAQSEVAHASAAVSKINNYYMPLAQTTSLNFWNPLSMSPEEILASPLLGLGGPIFLKDNVTNFELGGALLVPDLFNSQSFAIGHTQVAIDFAHTAGVGGFQPWGLRTSPVITGLPSPFVGGFWTQNSSGIFDRDYASPVLNELVDGTLLGVATFAEGAIQGTADALVDGLHTDIPIIQQVAKKAVGIIPNVVAADISGVNYVVQAAGDIASGLVNWILGSAHSPVSTSIQVAVPANASLMGFDLSVTDSGNNDVLQVAIGSKLIGQVDLSTAMALGGSSDMFWVSDYAGQTVTLNLVMPSDTPSTARFTIGNLKFASIQTGYLGDANHDGEVGFADLVAVAQHYGVVGSATWEMGDFDGDGNVSFADLVVVAQNYGMSPGGAAAPAEGLSFQEALAAAFAPAAMKPPMVSLLPPAKPVRIAVAKAKPVAVRRPNVVAGRNLKVATAATVPATNALTPVPAAGGIFGVRLIKPSRGVLELLN